jgi:hypothetical protein
MTLNLISTPIPLKVGKPTSLRYWNIGQAVKLLRYDGMMESWVLGDWDTGLQEK